MGRGEGENAARGYIGVGTPVTVDVLDDRLGVRWNVLLRLPWAAMSLEFARDSGL